VSAYYDVITTTPSSPQRMNDDQWEDELLNKKRGRVSIVKKLLWTDDYSF